MLEPVFYRGNRVWVLVLVCVFKSLNFNSYAPELVPIFYYRDKTRVQMFDFLKIEHYNRYIKVNKINNCTHIDCVHSESVLCLTPYCKNYAQLQLK